MNEIEKLLSPTQYKYFIKLGENKSFQEIAEEENIKRASLTTQMWIIRDKLERHKYIKTRHYTEKTNYNYLIDYAKKFNENGLQPILDNYGNKCKIIEEFDSTITDRILLKLLCLLVNNISPITFIAGEKDIGIKNIKNLILEACIKSYEIKEQVSKLFESEEV